MTASDFYNNLNTALDNVDQAIAAAQAAMTDEFDTTNYSDILIRLTTFRRNIIRLQNANKFLRLSKEGFALQATSSTGKKVEIIHTVKDYETPFSIVQQYGVSLDDVLNKNNITTADFTAGLQLKVDIDPSQGLNQIYDNIPSYGDQSGSLVFGSDLPNTLAVDTNGDLIALSPEDTLAQGINNRTQTKQGDYPLVSDFGLSPLVGSEIPNDLTNALYIKEIENSLAQDSRIASIDDLQFTRKGNAINITCQITAINNKNLSIAS